ncbi:hypothetical protein Syun_021456 [Stephania yunnanensis]|uniref:Rieske domain-containing protein n=1 Tax=Stephania yunnanensis TaxID=152371 RepID=A0AAP0IFM2_9MAGN
MSCKCVLPWLGQPTAMQSLTTSSFNLSKIPKSLPPPNGFTLLPIFPQLPTSSLPHLTHKTTSKSKRFSTALPRDPSPELEDSEIGEESERFDWYSQWYPVAPICDLDKRVPHAKRVMGIDIVVWWDRKEEKWQVFDDSCPHRLAPLSEGRIDQWGRLQCVYHGWCFDGTGDCNFIPQVPPDGPPVHTFKKACAVSYPSIEQNKIVWFWPKSEPQYKNIAMKRKPPCIPELDDPSYSSLMGQRDFPFGSHHEMRDDESF